MYLIALFINVTLEVQQTKMQAQTSNKTFKTISFKVQILFSRTTRNCLKKVKRKYLAFIHHWVLHRGSKIVRPP